MENLYVEAPGRQSILPLVSFDRPARCTPRARDGCFRIVNAARFTQVKNQAALVWAIALLIAEGRDARLILFDEGAELETCRELAAQLGIAAWVEFKGFVPDWPERPADLFVLLSHHDGLCIVALEAMHAGLPVAAPLIGGLQDYGVPTLSCVLPSVLPADIAIAMRTAMDGGPRLREAALKAAIMVDQRFGTEAVARQYHEINEELMSAATLRVSAGAEPMRRRPAHSKS